MKLLTKLIIAFTGIVLVIGLFQYIYFQKQIKTEFQQFLVNQEMGMITKLETYFESYYLATNTFAGVEELLQSNSMMMGRMHGRMLGNPAFSNFQIMIADQNGMVIAASQKDDYGKPAKDVLGTHRELFVNDKYIGELIVIQEEDMLQQSLVKQFIQSTNVTILLGTIIGSFIAALVGFFIARGMTKPVTKLIEGIQKISSGDTSYRIQLANKDEFYQLSKAFNEMANQLAQNERLRQNLMADVAHELRTPLAIIRGKLESIQEGIVEANEMEIMLLVDEVYRLSRLVNDLQQLSLAEAGKLPLNKRPINVNELIEKVMLNFAALTEEKDISLLYNSTSKDIILCIDEDRITQVIVNLLDNALRHTPQHGQITITVEKENDSDKVMIAISDTGPGIDSAFLPTIFDRFYRTDFSRNRNYGGVGLGLSIAKGFIEAHNGVISVTSEKGKGTTFFIRFPCEIIV